MLSDGRPVIFTLSLLFLLSLFSDKMFAQAQHDDSASSKPAPANILAAEASEISFLRCLVVYQHDQLITSHTKNEATLSHPYNIKSASKSVMSLLIGIAIDEGFIEGTHLTLKELFPEYFSQNPDSAKEEITLKHLLSMQSGLETTSFDNYGRWIISKNWAYFALNQPMVEEPGGKMLYSTGTSHLLSVIITNKTGMSTKRFAEKYLFEPLNIRIGGWDRDPQGYYMGGNNLAMKPVDMAKIGQIMLNNGLYEGKRIVSEQWIAQTFQVYTHSIFNPYRYGFMWWKEQIGGVDSWFAWGFGGQYIFTFPELDAVVVWTSDLTKTSLSRNYRHDVFSYLEEVVVPYLRRNP